MDIDIFISQWLSRIILKVSQVDIKHKYRELEKITIKIIKDESHLAFNLACLQNNLLPIYTNIYIKANFVKKSIGFHCY